MASRQWTFSVPMKMELDKAEFNGKIKGAISVPIKDDFFFLPTSTGLNMYKVKDINIDKEGNWEAKIRWCPSNCCINCRRYFEVLYSNEELCPRCK